MKARVFFWSVISALAGFLLSFDPVVVSGAKKAIQKEQAIQKVWDSSAGMQGFAMAAALYGTVVGAVLGGTHRPVRVEKRPC